MFWSVPTPPSSGPDSDAWETGSQLAAAREPSSARPERRRFGCAGVFLISLLILCALAGFLLYRMERVAENSAAGMLDWGGRVRDALVAVTGMQPRVIVNEQVVFEQARPVLELAVLERDATVERKTESHWMGSTRRLRIRGLYHVKVGYNLADNFTVNVVGNNAEVIRLQLPPPKVLSVEQKNLEVLTMDNGLWNHLSSDELANEVNTLRLEAHLKANQNGTPAEAQRMFIERLLEKLGPGHRVEIVAPAKGSRPPATPDAPK